MNFDADQNWQIEQHYQDCCNNIKPSNSQHTIIGDMAQVKNGWMYKVWGPSKDASTWFE